MAALVRLSGVLGAEDAATVQAALHPLCQPVPDDDRTTAQRRADALVDVCRLALRTGQLPDDGGEPPQLAVTVSYDSLTQAVSAATTDSGQRPSAATTRQLACDARVLPVVLGGAGQILDTGRTRRLATGPLRRALHVRDRGCAFPDCDRPPRWGGGHHMNMGRRLRTEPGEVDRPAPHSVPPGHWRSSDKCVLCARRWCRPID